MNRIIYSLFFSLLAISAFSQETPDNLLDELDAVDSKDRVIFELVQNNWLNAPDSVAYKWYSVGFNTYLMYDVALNKDRNFSLAPGIGLSVNSWYNDGRLSLDTATNITRYNEVDDQLVGSGPLLYDKNKLSAIYGDFYGEFRFRTDPDKFSRRYKAAVGFKLGYLLSSYEKYRGANEETNIGEVKYKSYKIPNMNNIRFGVTGRIGYSNFNLVGFYSLSTLFLPEKGPGIQPFSIGISFNSL